jgi:hypothetical protein
VSSAPSPLRSAVAPRKCLKRAPLSDQSTKPHHRLRAFFRTGSFNNSAGSTSRTPAIFPTILRLAREGLTRRGFRVAAFNGEDKSGVELFKKREVDVLIGSRALGIVTCRSQLPKSAGPRHRWVFGSLYRFAPQLLKVAVVVSFGEEVPLAASAAKPPKRPKDAKVHLWLRLHAAQLTLGSLR